MLSFSNKAGCHFCLLHIQTAAQTAGAARSAAPMSMMGHGLRWKRSNKGKAS